MENTGTTDLDKNQDHYIRGFLYNGSLRCVVVVCTRLVQEICEIHHCDPLASIVQGRALAGTALMGAAGLKNQGEVVQAVFSGTGPLAQVLAEFTFPDRLRGYVANPQIPADQNPFPQTPGEAMGKGTIQIKRTAKDKKDPYTGVSGMASGEIGEDLAKYYLDSEQLPSSISVGVKLDSEGKVIAAGGILIQKMGGAELDPGVLERLDEKLGKELSISEAIYSGLDAEAILTKLDSSKIMLKEFHSLSYHCPCSRERMATALRSLGATEIRSIQEEVGKIETLCHYCRTTYGFTSEELLQPRLNS